MILVGTEAGFTIGASAALVEPGENLRAWAERLVRQDSDIAWILGNYVEADQPNSNGHIFPLDELVTAQHTVAGKPLNMLHREHYIVGAFAGAQLLTPEGVDLTAQDLTHFEAAEGEYAYVEALAGMWRTRFPEELFNIRRAHKEGQLFFSMEAMPSDVSCPTCEHRSAFAGLESETYCEHMQGAVGPKRLHDPVFNGGAIIIPPVQPGWKRADVKAISKLLQDTSMETLESVYAQCGIEAPHLGAREWELLMDQILLQSRQFTPKQRDDAAQKKQAMPDGSFPIKNASDLKNAIKAIGRAKDPAAAKAHIKRRAKELGLEELLPDGW